MTGGTVSTTGIAGLTLGGGFGWLMAAHGLAADNLLSAEVITANGDILAANAAENKDLFWALRGGGGNFGVVTAFEYRLHSPPRSPEASWRTPSPPLGTYCVHSASSSAPPLTSWGSSRRSRARSRRLRCQARGTRHLPRPGDAEQAENELAPIVGFGSPLLSDVGVMPYPKINTLLDAA